MIHGYSSIPSMLDKLNSLPSTVFYPTGSRYFGSHRENSDYDFFTENNPQVIAYLLDFGFWSISSADYKDSDCKAVYRFISNSGMQIDIQFSANVEMRKQVQETFKKNYIFAPNRDQWNTAFLFYREHGSPLPYYNLSNIGEDYHHFDNIIRAIKTFRESFFTRNSEGEYVRPTLIESKRFCEAMIHLALSRKS